MCYSGGAAGLRAVLEDMTASREPSRKKAKEAPQEEVPGHTHPPRAHRGAGRAFCCWCTIKRNIKIMKVKHSWILDLIFLQVKCLVQLV